MSKVGCGFHDFSREFYLSDPCPQPSLDSAGIRLLLDASPAHFAAAHPRLTKWPEQLVPKHDGSLGAVVRALVLNKGHEVAALPFDDWTTKAAQFQRKQAREDGKIPTTRAVYDEALAIAEGARSWLGMALKLSSSTGATLIWRRPLTDSTIWCREQLDVQHFGMTVLVQTVNKATTDAQVSKAVESGGLDLRLAFILDGLSVTWPGRAILAVIVTIELEPPYTVSVRELSAEWLSDLRGRIDDACNVFAACLKGNAWPNNQSPSPLQQPPRRAV